MRAYRDDMTNTENVTPAPDTDEVGELLTEEQVNQRFAEVVASCRDIITGFADPTLNVRDWLVANDAMGFLAEQGDLIEFASAFMLMAAERGRASA
jgi:hypothetical protein